LRSVPSGPTLVDVKSVIGGMLGFIVGFAVGILIFEVAWANDESWPDAAIFGVAVFGALVGSSLSRRVGHRAGARDRHASAQ
jgi:hypothetical protein